MATLTTSQKAPLVVSTESGIPVLPFQQAVELSGDPCVHMVNTNSPDANWIVADVPGTATVTVSSAGQVGALEVVVTAAPLSVGLGSPEPK